MKVREANKKKGVGSGLVRNALVGNGLAAMAKDTRPRVGSSRSLVEAPKSSPTKADMQQQENGRNATRMVEDSGG